MALLKFFTQDREDWKNIRSIRFVVNISCIEVSLRAPKNCKVATADSLVLENVYLSLVWERTKRT